MTAAQFLRRFWAEIALVALAAQLVTLVVSDTAVFRRLDGAFLDARMVALSRPLEFQRVLAVDVDEESIARLSTQLGAWPYDREIYAAVAGYLLDAGARSVAFDILFSEPRKGDAEFARVLEPRVVLAAAALPQPFGRERDYVKRLEQISVPASPSLPAFKWPDITLPIAPLAARASVGAIGVAPDGDSVLRRVPVLHETYGRVLPSLSVAALFAGKPPPAARAPDGSLQLGDLRVPVSASGEATLFFPSDFRSLPVVPFHRIVLATLGAIDDRDIRAQVRDRAVFVGSSSAILGDYVYTPSGRLSGLHLVAAVPEMMLAGRVLRPPSALWNGVLTLVALGLVFAASFPGINRRPLLYFGALPFLVVCVVGGNLLLLLAGQDAALLVPLTVGITAHFLSMLTRFLYLHDRNRALQMEKAAAEEAAKLKSQFISHMTHELRTPLTAIIGFNQINWQGDDLGREARMRNSAIVDANCRHLLGLVNNMLDQAQIEAGQMSVTPRPTDFAELGREVADSLASIAAGKGLSLDISMEDVPPRVAIDPVRVRQILINLTGNALKFTDQGGVRIECSWRAGRITVHVVDTGPGMSEAALARIFEAFQQADDSVAVRHGGTGLGLTITRTLARLMDGEVTVQSAPAQGSRFTVTFAAPEAALPAPAAASQALPAARLLLAEDNEDIRELVGRQLRRLGFEVTAVENGLLALEHALAEKPDAILMDLEMPRMNGREATEALRAQGFKAPIVALTAHESAEELENARRAGCDAVVSKPVSPQALRETLSSVLARV